MKLSTGTESRTATKRPEALFAAVPLGLFRSTPAGDVLAANPAWLEMFGYPDLGSLSVAAPAAWFADPEDRERLVAAMEKSGEVRDFEFEAQRRDGSTWRARTSVRAVRDRAGRIEFHEGVVEDVTGRKSAEERQRRTQDRFLHVQKLDVIGQLAGGVAHDFNNLLTAIYGYAEMARPELVRAIAYVDEIRDAADRAAKLTDQLLAFGRVQPGERTPLDLNEVVRETLQLLRRVIGEDVKVDLRLAPALGLVSADASRLGQVLVNLAVNARDAMPRGGTLTVQTSEVELGPSDAARLKGLVPGRHVRLSVADTGIGMDAAALARLADPSSAAKEPGARGGLGLAAVFAIVEQFHGHVEADTAQGEGTTFRIYLPRVEGSAERTPAPAAPTQAPRGHETILLVEDDDRLRELVRQILENAGYTVLPAGDGTDVPALARTLVVWPDLLLTDVVMPDRSGPEVAAELKAAGCAAPVLYMSGYGDSVLVEHGLIESGASHLSKPFTANGLLSKVREVLDARRKI